MVLQRERERECVCVREREREREREVSYVCKYSMVLQIYIVDILLYRSRL